MAKAHSVELSYTRKRDAGEPERYRYEVHIERTLCRFGGSRPWFRCTWCNRRCALIYGLSQDGYFACRICLKLGYTSESESVFGRLWRKMEKLEAKLIDGELKPKWMRWRTIERISARMDAIDEALNAESLIRCARFFERHGTTSEDFFS